MKDTLKAGVSKTVTINVDRDRTIDFMGDECRVYATPNLVRDIEMTCRELLLEHLDQGEDSVGSRIEVDHTAPTLMGMDVELTVTISSADGRAIAFDIAGKDPVDTICGGKHNRFVVDVAKTAERLKAKAAKAS